MPQINYPATFDNNDLTTITGLTVLSTNPSIPPKRKLSIYNVMRSNQSQLSYGYYVEKSISVRVGITRTTRPLVEQSVDSLMALLQGLEKDLLLYQSGSLRRYVCTLSDVVVVASGGSYTELELVFICSDRFGYDLQYTKLLDVTGRTLYNYTDPLTFEGTASTQAPVITAFISALSGATNNVVTIENVSTGKGISVSQAWVAGDRLVIDVQHLTVKVNGVEVDFTGSFPEFAPGVGYINYQDNFNSRTLALSVYYNKRYV